MTALTIIAEARVPDAEDSTLGRRFADGEAEAFETIVSLYQTRVTRLAHRLLGWSGDPEDVVQDVFLAALQNSANFRGDASLYTWLATLTLNQCRRRMARRALWQRFIFASSRDSSQTATPADHVALTFEVSQRVRDAVAALPRADREVIVLYYLEEMPVAEISRLLGATPNALQVRLHRARGKLESMLAKFMEQDHA